MNYFQRLSKKQIYVATAVAGPLLIALGVFIFPRPVQVLDETSTNESVYLQIPEIDESQAIESVLGTESPEGDTDPSFQPPVRLDAQEREAIHRRLLELSVNLAKKNAHLQNLIQEYDNNLSSPEHRKRLSQELLNSKEYREDLIERIELEERLEAANDYEQ